MAEVQLTEWQSDGVPIQVSGGYRESAANPGILKSGPGTPTEGAQWQIDAYNAMVAKTLTFVAGTRPSHFLIVGVTDTAFPSTARVQTQIDAVYGRMAIPAAPTADSLGQGLEDLLNVAPHLSADDVLPIDSSGERYVEWEPGVEPEAVGDARTLGDLRLQVRNSDLTRDPDFFSSTPVPLNVRAFPYTGASRPAPTREEGVDLGTYLTDPGQAEQTIDVASFTVPADWTQGAVLAIWASIPSEWPTYVRATLLSDGISAEYTAPRYRYRPALPLDERRDARASVAGVVRDLYSIKVDREIATVLPEQVAGGGGIMAGTAQIELAESETVTLAKVGPWARKNGWPLAPHESVTLDVNTGTQTHRVFTGRVESVHGSASAQEVVGTVRDDARWLDTVINQQALLAAMPPVNAGPQRHIGLRAEYLVDKVFRQGGFFATPVRETGSSLSVTAQGSLWPEGRGAGDTTGVSVSTKKPNWHPAPWGWCYSDVQVTFVPSPVRNIAAGFQLMLMAAPNHAGTGYVDVVLGEAAQSVRLTVRPDRSVSVALTGVASHSWTPPAGWEVVELRISGTTWEVRTDNGGQVAWTVAGTSGISTTPIANVDVVADANARLGAVQLSHPGNGPAFEAVSWTRNAHMLVGDLFEDLVATPGLENEDGLRLVAAISEAMVTSVWVDEHGHIWWVHPDRLRDQPAAMTLTSTADLLDFAWEDHADHARSVVTLHASRPTLYDTGGVNIATRTVSSDVSFAPMEWALSPDGKSEIDSILRDDVPGDSPRMIVSGHTDNLPNTNGMSNQELSERRAGAVRDYIRSIKPNASIETRGHGDTRPIATNSTDAGRAKNRRVEIAWSTIDETGEAKHREYAVTVWEGSGDTLAPGDQVEQILHPGGGEDWVMIAPPVGLTPTGDLARFNMGLGSWAGGLAAYKDGEETWLSFAPVTATLSHIAPRTWKLTKKTSTRLSIDVAAVEKVAEDARLAPSRRGDNLPILRAKVRVEWEDVEHTSTTRGAAHLPRLEHDTGVWVHDAASLRRLADWIAGQVTDPPALLRDLPIEYNPALKLGMVVDIVEDVVYGVTLRVLVTGISLRVEDGSSEMSLTARTIAVIEHHDTTPPPGGGPLDPDPDEEPPPGEDPGVGYPPVYGPTYPAPGWEPTVYPPYYEPTYRGVTNG